MAERKTREEKMSAVQQKLENGVREIFSSEKYKEYIAEFPVSYFPLSTPPSADTSAQFLLPIP